MPKDDKDSLKELKELSAKICQASETKGKVKSQLMRLIKNSTKMDKKEIINTLRKIVVNINV